ncbi:VRR-NUC domain-containing protein, partial [Hygrophoropsis aurantiaca]
MSGSPSTAAINSLVFSCDDRWELDQQELAGFTGAEIIYPGETVAGPSTLVQQENNARRPISHAYVEVFEEMLATVIKHEQHLLSADEIDRFVAFNNLTNNAKFLMVKLLLRKPDSCFRLDSLDYGTQMGGIEGVLCAIEELCRSTSFKELQEEIQVKEEEQEVIDLTLGLEDNPPQPEKPETEPEQPVAGPSTLKLEESKPEPIVLAEDETNMDLRSLLECLKLDELKAIGKQWKVTAAPRKHDLISALINSTLTQSTISFCTPKNRTKSATNAPLRQTKLPFFSHRSPKTSQERLRQVVIKTLRKCVRLNSTFVSVIRRANLIFFRSTQYTPNLLLPALLCRFNKRFYPAYTYSRTDFIWRTREDLLAYEAALEVEGRIDAIFNGDATTTEKLSRNDKTPVRFTGHQFRTPITPVKTGNSSTFSGPMKTPDVRYKDKVHKCNVSEQTHMDFEPELDVKPEPQRIRAARLVLEIFEIAYPQWKDLVQLKGEEDEKRFGLERFDCGHVLTRVVCKGAYALGVLHEYAREVEILETLLSQTRWRRGRRGKWHERRLVILMSHFPQDNITRQRALDCVIQAIHDPDTHIIYRPKLVRRLTKLEKQVGLPLNDRHTSEGKLLQAEKATIEGIRIRHRAASLALDRTGRNTSKTTAIATPKKGPDIMQFLPSVVTNSGVKSEKPLSTTSLKNKGKLPADEQKGKSIWCGRDGEEVNVETLALQWYEEQGFKGRHCETRVIRMIFGLLLWDILFSPVPGAFETPYQSAPLDVAEDSFYHSRKDAIEQRLQDIEDGEAVEIVKRIDGVHREKSTWCVGVQWDLFSSEDLVQIVNCIGGKALAVICRVLCEDFAGRCSGGPDLFLWNAEKGTCKFVEVKGPGDTLSENQKIWIDVLLRAPVPVEVCHVAERGLIPEEKSKKRRKRKAEDDKTGVKEPSESDDEAAAIESEDDPNDLPPSSQTI